MDFSIRRDVIEAQKISVDKGKIPSKKIAKSEFERIFEKECQKVSGKPINISHIEEVSR